MEYKVYDKDDDCIVQYPSSFSEEGTSFYINSEKADLKGDIILTEDGALFLIDFFRNRSDNRIDIIAIELAVTIVLSMYLDKHLSLLFIPYDEDTDTVSFIDAINLSVSE